MIGAMSDPMLDFIGQFMLLLSERPFSWMMEFVKLCFDAHEIFSYEGQKSGDFDEDQTL